MRGVRLLATAARPVCRPAFPKCRAFSAAAGSAAELAASSDVVVFSKTTCGFCAKTKATLEGLSVPFTAIELDTLPDGAALQAELATLSGQRTVPNVYVKGTHLGGNDDMQAAVRSGEFQKMLES